MRHVTSLLPLAAILLFVPACGTSTTAAVDAAQDEDDAATLVDATTGIDAAGADAAALSDAAANDAAPASDAGCDRPDAVVGSTDVMCNATPVVFPTIDRSCCDTSDCAVVRHQIDCCGSFTQTGISASAEAAFQTAETTCESQYPRCRCLARPDVANDETMATTSTDVATVRCVDRVCQTTFAL
jgi:hypothetical protein